ncbi:hypothetical protein EA462_13730 [Natrarchaeobius halalkaliphilus]|uniref:DUF1468 domain-containing protein n=1 Tax=Natrarchaeobius halalkaliphilus TaxID=1679091 RepID=A0A3N6P0D5_9EURY|nr:tripartite tricarboxylate transporter TctB family protein [Natrarchaeobius halalkaliphilus]RQG87918.1 hypothetical protein EA462_13730 [Natrarchaeobius halalkaliphilus]
MSTRNTFVKVMERANQTIDSASQWIYNNERKLEIAFVVALLAFFAYAVVTGMDYRRNARLVPTIIAVPTIALLVLVLATLLSSRFAAFAASIASSDMLGIHSKAASSDTQKGESPQSDPFTSERTPASEKRLIMMVLWTGLLLGLVVAIGFSVAILVFAIGFYRIYSGESWYRSVGYAVVLWAFVIVVFQILADIDLYGGIVL